ncbi:porin [Psychrobium sp. 1_MG-2023]|uniref:porin n=1 Tax=Psychrobium sp. 1_MG-2023 TaxID=3062624 RepID=UPI0026A459EE|nr:porin [Psychrobium sp. 1_MG-2023]MDP2560660.1 porin [Psychrobium sp. 1_MG-2023]
MNKYRGLVSPILVFLYCFLALLILSFPVQAKPSTERQIEFSGFARVIAGQANDKLVEYDQSLDFTPDSLLGIQGDLALTNSLSVTAQLVGSFADKKNSGLEWLYLSYQPDSPWSFKLGRQRTAFFNYSDVQNVGYSYHWLKPPNEVYASFMFSHIDGLAATYRATFPDATFSIEGTFGQFKDELAFEDRSYLTEIRDAASLFFSLEFEDLTVRAGYSTADFDIDDPVFAFAQMQFQQAGFDELAQTFVIADTLEYYQVGFSYDKFDYFLKGEWIRLTHDLAWIPHREGYYISAGYVFADYLFHLTYAKRDDTLSPIEVEFSPIPELQPIAGLYQMILGQLVIKDQESLILGVRNDLTEHVALKAELNFTTMEKYSSPYQPDSILGLIGIEWVF